MPTRAVRFSDEENEKIKRLLKENPFLDFSTMARIAISNFLDNPEIKIKTSNNIRTEEKGINHGSH